VTDLETRSLQPAVMALFKYLIVDSINSGYWTREHHSPSFCLASLKLSSQLARLSGFANMTDIFSMPVL